MGIYAVLEMKILEFILYIYKSRRWKNKNLTALKSNSNTGLMMHAIILTFHVLHIEAQINIWLAVTILLLPLL
jgi:hypothetical protein